ncbi:unnamed protein product [Miscanthus lutarioriparius]|uniref:Uncharacterized protein n=1 Tax=Miscanthus lutarioriparius TaxID=422564 RepID=A0A811QN08_9POAL|nr:unnamed protein product [Miscanthus lutarioriparius]
MAAPGGGVIRPAVTAALGGGAAIRASTPPHGGFDDGSIGNPLAAPLSKLMAAAAPSPSRSGLPWWWRRRPSRGSLTIAVVVAAADSPLQWRRPLSGDRVLLGTSGTAASPMTAHSTSALRPPPPPEPAYPTRSLSNV